MFILLTDGGVGYTDAVGSLGSVEVLGPFSTWHGAMEKAIALAEEAWEDFDDDDGTFLDMVSDDLETMRDPLGNPDLRVRAACKVHAFCYAEQGGLAIIGLG